MALLIRRLLVCAVAAVVGGTLGACGDDAGDTGDAVATTTLPAPTTAVPTTVVHTTAIDTTGVAATAVSRPPTSAPKMPASTAAAGCSAAGISADVAADPVLPPAVAAMRADLARAAATCDWSALALLVDRDGPAVRASFGDDRDPIGYWQRLEAATDETGPKPMRALRTLLGLPGTLQPGDGNGPDTYVWPPAFASEEPTEAELQQVADTGLYTMDQLHEWRDFGMNYLGYRILITANGDWTAFVAGD